MRILEITTAIGCINCAYCPQEKLKMAYNGQLEMSIDTFKTILNNTPQDVEIMFAGFCEPFKNHKAALMMKLAIESGREVSLYTTKAYLNIFDIRILSGIKGYFKSINIHKLDTDKYQLELTKIKSKSVTITEVKHPWSRAGNLFDTPSKIGKIKCTSTDYFDHNVVLPNGDVVLCCMDYSLQHPIGNLLSTNFNNINRDCISYLATQDNSPIICRNCECSEIIKLQ